MTHVGNHNITTCSENNGDGFCNMSIESPYRNCVSAIKTLNTSGDDDFKTRKQNLRKVRGNKKQHPRDVKKSKQLVFVKSKDNVPKSDVNAEHLQLAIALSHSLQTSSKNDLHDATISSVDISSVSVSKNATSLKESLAKFGFYTSSKMKPRISPVMKNKKSQYRYVTPVLLSRTEENRQRIISEKIAQILSNLDEGIPSENFTANSFPSSKNLLKLWSITTNLFGLSCNSCDAFEAMHLNTSYAVKTCGNLLKDWKSIPLRESPERTTKDVKKDSAAISTITADQALESLDNKEQLFDLCTTSVTASKCIDFDLSQTHTAELSVANCINESSSNKNCSLAQNEISQTNVESRKILEKNITDEAQSTVSEIQSFKDAAADVAEHHNINEREHFQIERKNSFRHCVSPELFLSEEEETEEEVAPPTVIDVSSDEEQSQSLLTYSPKKSNIKEQDFKFEKTEEGSKIYKSPELKRTFAAILNERRNAENQQTTVENLFSGNLTDTNETAVLPTAELKNNFFVEGVIKNDDTLRNCDSFQDADIEMNEMQNNRGADNKSFSQLTVTEKSLNITDYIQNILTQDAQSESSDTENLHKDSANDEELQTECSVTLTPQRSTSPQPFSEATSARMIVKTKGVTPMSNYKVMNTPEVVEELNKFGVKPLKRKRGIEMLKYLYNMTHPIIKDGASDESITKRLKKDTATEQNKKNEVCRNISERFETSTENTVTPSNIGRIKIVEDLLTPGEKVILEKHCSPKTSCRTPLHIAFYNLISSNRTLRKSILLYEPLHLEIVHGMLKEKGHNFHKQDLLTFLDKKCITIQTNPLRSAARKIKNR